LKRGAESGFTHARQVSYFPPAAWISSRQRADALRQREQDEPTIALFDANGGYRGARGIDAPEPKVRDHFLPVVAPDAPDGGVKLVLVRRVADGVVDRLKRRQDAQGSHRGTA
jgi:hypothetical protein